MREIKFRAWDFEDKEMFEVPRLDLHDLVPMNKRRRLMQFTGLKDKNSMEIYEGDVIKFDKNPVPLPVSHKEKIYFVVEWSKYDAGFYPFNFSGIGDRCEILGNIFENPELWEEKK